ncbi:MAG: tyrosine-type recombinase/integrase [Bacteroidales bacterium]|nr:tyrosine-type recombinase/integrase [Bacteroidales bacterium]
MEVVGDFLNHCKYEKRLSPKTIKAYTIDLKQFEDFLANQLNITDIHQIGKDDIKKYIQILSEFKPKTIKRKLAAIKSMFNQLEYEDVIEQNPFRKVKLRIKEPRTLPTVMTLDEVRSIFDAIYNDFTNVHSSNIYSYKEKLRNIAVVELLFGTGVRVSELCTLTKNNIPPDFSLIKVNGKGSKERKIQIENNDIRKVLKDYYILFKDEIENSGYFFINRLGKRLSEQSVRLMIRKYKKLSHIEKRITPHVFRHSFATLLLEQDVDIKYIQNLLGHSSIVTTQIYTHVSTEKQTEILHNKHPRNSLNFTV